MAQQHEHVRHWQFDMRESTHSQQMERASRRAMSHRCTCSKQNDCAVAREGQPLLCLDAKMDTVFLLTAMM